MLQNYSYSGTHGVHERSIKPKLLCARQGCHSDAKRSEDKQNGGKFHTSFISAMVGVWSNTRIWTPEAENLFPVSSYRACVCYLTVGTGWICDALLRIEGARRRSIQYQQQKVAYIFCEYTVHRHSSCCT